MNHKVKVILGGLMGNMVEAYDLSICYFLSTSLSRVLIGDNSGNPSIVLLLIFLAYLAKPLGAFILGLLSDLYGRKRVLVGSILIVGLSTAGIGFIPSHETIGLAAPLFLLLLRAIQSMAMGSEFLNSATFLVESGDEKQKGFRGCWPSVGVKAGYLLATLVVAVMNHYSSSTYISDWIWRLPFILALLTTVIGALIRTSIPESLGYVLYYSNREKPTTQAIYKQSLVFVKKYPFMFNYAFFTIFLSVATGIFFYLYIPLHSIQYSQLSRDFILTSTAISLFFVSILIPLFGWISDYKDRLKILTFASTGLLVLAYPFMHAVNFGNAAYFLLMQLLISIPCAAYYSVSTVILTELFPLPIRCTSLSITYSLAASLAAGIPPLLADYLSRATNMPNSPAFIIMTIAIIVLTNIKILTQRYRTGINRYDVNLMDETPPLYTVEYQKS